MMWLIRGIRDLPPYAKWRITLAWLCFAIGCAGVIAWGNDTHDAWLYGALWFGGWSVIALCVAVDVVSVGQV